MLGPVSRKPHVAHFTACGVERGLSLDADAMLSRPVNNKLRGESIEGRVWRSDCRCFSRAVLCQTCRQLVRAVCNAAGETGWEDRFDPRRGLPGWGMRPGPGGGLLVLIVHLTRQWAAAAGRIEGEWPREKRGIPGASNERPEYTTDYTNNLLQNGGMIRRRAAKRVAIVALPCLSSVAYDARREAALVLWWADGRRTGARARTGGRVVAMSGRPAQTGRSDLLLIFCRSQQLLTRSGRRERRGAGRATGPRGNAPRLLREGARVTQAVGSRRARLARLAWRAVLNMAADALSEAGTTPGCC